MTTILPSAINATIAELLEPFKFVAFCENYEYRDGHYYSRGGCWESHDAEPVGIGEWRRADWQPLDFLHDARGTVMLDDWLVNHNYGLELGKGGLLLIDHNQDPCTVADIDGELQACRAHAFLRAYNITVEGGDAK